MRKLLYAAFLLLISLSVFSATQVRFPGTDTTDPNEGMVSVDVNGSALSVTLATLISGEDQTNNVLVVEQGQFTGIYETGNDSVTSSAGYLHTLTFMQSDAAPTAGSIVIYDNDTAAGGTTIYSETFTTTAFRGYSVHLDQVFTNGLYIEFNTIADIGVNISYR